MKDKLLCVLESNVDEIKRYSNYNSMCPYGYYYFKSEAGLIRLTKEPVFDYKTENFDIEVSNFWGRKKIIHDTRTISVITGYKGIINYAEKDYEITKEEYDNILKIREEKIKNKQIEELNKLCNKE